MSQDDLVTAKELAQILDPELRITVPTINHWTNLGILPIGRRIGRIRYFPKQPSASIVKRVRELQNQNYPLEVIAQTIKKEKIEP